MTDGTKVVSQTEDVNIATRQIHAQYEVACNRARRFEEDPGLILRPTQVRQPGERRDIRPILGAATELVRFRVIALPAADNFTVSWINYDDLIRLMQRMFPLGKLTKSFLDSVS